MPNLPFFTLAPALPPGQPSTGSTTSASTALNTQGQQSSNPLAAGDSDENSDSSSLSFYQALNDQLEEPILPAGQDIAAYVQGESELLPSGLSEAVELQQVAGKASQVDGQGPESPSPWMVQAPIDVEDIQQQRAAQIQIQGTPQPHRQNPQQLRWHGEQLNKPDAQSVAGNALDNKAGVAAQAPPLLSSATSALAGPLTPDNAAVGVNPLAQQNHKMLSTNENLSIDDASLLDGELELANIHEKPLTLTPKTGQAIPLAQVTPAQLAQVVPAQLAGGEIPDAIMQTSQVVAQKDMTTGPLDASKVLASDPILTAAPQEKLKLDMPPNSIQWSEQISKRIAIMNSEGLQSARIQLDPPELGALEIKIKMTSDQVNVGFTSSQPAVREALEAQAPRLREMMEQEGINLADVNVSDQGQQQGGGQSDDEQMLGEESGINLESDGEISQTTVSQSDSLVDYFA